MGPPIRSGLERSTGNRGLQLASEVESGLWVPGIKQGKSSCFLTFSIVNSGVSILSSADLINACARLSSFPFFSSFSLLSSSHCVSPMAVTTKYHTNLFARGSAGCESEIRALTGAFSF